MTIDWPSSQDKEKYENLLQTLLDSERSCVAFVGAGISINALYPPWTQLLSNLRQRADESRIAKGLQALVYPQHDEEFFEFKVAQICHDELADEFYHILEEVFDPKKHLDFLSIHYYLLHIPFKAYLTTNYDLLLEHAAPEVRESGKIFYYSKLDPTSINQSSVNFYHIHGIVFTEDGQSHARSTLLTLRQIQKAYQDEPYIGEFIRPAYRNSTFVFFGFNPLEPFFYKLLGAAHEISKAEISRFSEIEGISLEVNPHYVFMKTEHLTSANGEKSRDVAREKSQDDALIAVGILTIRYNPEASHSQLQGIVSDMRTQTGRSPQFTAPRPFTP